LIKSEEYSVVVTDAINNCTQEGSVTPNVQIIAGVKLELIYLVYNNQYVTIPPDDPFPVRLSPPGHGCNRARFEVFVNNVSQGIANLNNAGGVGDIPPVPHDIDDYNLPPSTPPYAYPSQYDRYWSKVITSAEAENLADATGKLNITLYWTGTGNTQYIIPHSDASWIRISDENGNVLVSTTVNLFSNYVFDPYA